MPYDGEEHKGKQKRIEKFQQKEREKEAKKAAKLESKKGEDAVIR